MLSPVIQDHFFNRRNVGPLEGATHRGAVGMAGEGPYALLWLEVEGDRIRRAAYETYGCPAAVACLSMLAEAIAGRTLEQARRLDARDLAVLLRGLPEGKEECADRAVAALAAALGDPQ